MPRSHWQRFFIVFTVVAAGAVHVLADAPVDTRLAVATAAGPATRPLDALADAKAVVLVFVGQDCPISNGYAPVLAELAKAFAATPFYVIYADADLTPAAATQHAADYKLPGTVLLDRDGRLARTLGATVTPEAFVIAPGGRVVYRGAIDDAYAGVGRKRFAATQPYLKNALADLAAGRPVTLPKTRAVGCELP